MTVNNSHRQKVNNYYRFHSKIYDATRWSFLFGRRSLIREIPDLPANPRILEIGCGTGYNIQHLQERYPQAQITGIDHSTAMLNKARKKIGDIKQICLLNTAYGSQELNQQSFDLILLSYSLTMMGTSTASVFNHLHRDLKPGGLIAVVDFHTSPFSWFKHWMQLNYVDFSGRSLTVLNQSFKTIISNTFSTYFGLWSYYQFIGKYG